jgi:acetyl esterase/lipase
MLKIKYWLSLLSITFSFVALLSAIWILIPAPAYHLWLFAVAASEWSLWLGAIALIGIVCSLLNYTLYSNNKLWIAFLIMNCAAFTISLYPLFSILNLATENNVSLSLTNYFAGLNRLEKKNTNDFKTYTFAEAEGENLQLDIYLPTRHTSGSGASIIIIHGGSWSAGKRNDFPQWNEWFAAQGFTVFDVDYRLAPQPNYLSATGDVKCAVSWVKEHAAEFNISPDRIALLGRSAGGHLALLTAYSADKHFPTACAKNEQSDTVRAVISLYAPTDLIWAYDHPANQRVIDGPATLTNFLGGSPHESKEMQERFTLSSPAYQVSDSTPPTLLIHGGRDQLVLPDNMIILNNVLESSNVTHKTIYIPYAQHGFDYNFNGWGAQMIKPVILDFLLENTKAQ